MGIPKFFRYVSERYPCLSELAREQSIPEFDNLYLDMNGIIHKCSHPDDNNIHFNISEEDMFKDIFNYIDKLFFLIKPRKLFFMAIDGVAPRAKMNQQRSRRFRSAKDAEILEKQAIHRGEVLHDERFDSNCITPGTEFMCRLHNAMRHFVKSKVSSDPMWKSCSVILSGHDSPGEGEHKIMDYIRFLKSRKDYDPNTRHCLYGLDADLIILGLCTHELHFVVLREEVKFGRKTKHTSVEATRFFLLHLGLLREYLELEFDELRKQDKSFDISKLIDDWIFMGFLVGNDFIPHLPCMHISSNALTLLYKTYIQVYPTLGGNINESGKLNLQRLEKYFAALSEVEFQFFQENYADLKYFVTKKSKNGVDEAFDFDVSDINNENTDNDLAEFIESSRQFYEDDSEDLSDENQHIVDEFETYKRNYYLNKLKLNDMSSETKREQAIGYITALQWILDYYYRGVQSWDWYYPHHYAPFISDLQDFSDYRIKFNMGKPFKPFEQLLAVLPAASQQLLPNAYRDLMTNTNSELIHFYPTDFETDLNGKQHEWEAVVLIPFIDEKLLLKAMKACEAALTSGEIQRNRHGPMYQYDYKAESKDSVPGIYAQKQLCTEKLVWSKDIAISADKVVCVELPNASRTVFFAGFPTMKHLKYDFQIRAARVKVFDYASRNENVILMPQIRTGLTDVLAVADKYLDQIVFIGWPHLIKSKVVAVSNQSKYIDADGIKDNEPKVFQHYVKAAEEHLTTRMGIELKDFSVMVHVRTYVGSSYVCGSNGKVIMTDTWNDTIIAYPAQGVVSEINLHNGLLSQHKKVEELFPTNSTIFFVGHPYYGSEGYVLNPMLVYECGRLKVNITVLPEPNFAEAQRVHFQLQNDYINAYQAAAAIGIHTKCLSRITGTVLVISGPRRVDIVDNIAKTNIGLQFKYPKQQEERVGYARRINNQWYYSTKAIALIQAYNEQFPMVFKYLSMSLERNEFCFESDLFPEQIGDGCVEEIVAWVKVQDHMKVDKIACGSKTMEKEVVEKILESIEHLKSLPVKTVKLQVKAHLLLKPDISLPSEYKSNRLIKLFDRVVIVKTTYMVPLGAKGTVIGIYPVNDPNPVRLECVKAVDYFLEVLFDKHLPNGNDIHGIAHERVYNVPESAVLLIYTQDKANEMPKPKMQQFAVANCKHYQADPKDDAAPYCKPEPYIKTTTFESSNKTPSQTTYSEVSPTCNKKESGDFWMPSTNMKVKNTFLLQSAPKENAHENVKPKAQTFPVNTKTAGLEAVEECQMGTQVLKNLLGLSQGNNGVLQNKPDHFTQLPQPPPSWFNAAQGGYNNASYQHQATSLNCNFLEPQPMQYTALVDMANNASHIVPLAVAVPPPIWPTQLHNHQSEQFPVLHDSQNLNIRNDNLFSPESINQKGAFIPLQVMRTSHKNKIQPSKKLEQMQHNLNNISLTDPKSPKAPGNYESDSTNLSTLKTSVGRKRSPRVPKIGAKFDMTH